MLLTAIVAVFWFQDLRYSRPTPIPAHYDPPAVGDALPLSPALASQPGDTRPILLHFFNQDCPCSRFNVEQARTLVDKFHDRVRFVLILQTSETDPVAEQKSLSAATRKLGGVEGFIDCEGRLAERYGVYSTPQAVILDARGVMAYRGNYNSSRYCTDAATEFARLALEAVLDGRQPPVLPALAYQAYGCELPPAAIQ